MKNKSLLIGFFFVFFQIQAQKINHAIGLNYSQTLGTYGNSDVVNLLYTPQIQRNKGMFIYGISSPMTFGSLMVSSARSENNQLYIQIPIMIEMGLNLNNPCTSFKYLSMFTGLGFSREFIVGNSLYKSDFINTTIGIRVPPFNAPMEVRFNYAVSMQQYNNKVLSLGVSYIFK